ncbi:MAG: ferredoxin [Pseudomonadota bacterium]
MFVCICNGIREVDLRHAATRCCGEADAVYRQLGKTPQCRKCLDDAEEILLDARAAALAGGAPGPLPCPARVDAAAIELAA